MSSALPDLDRWAKAPAVFSIVATALGGSVGYVLVLDRRVMDIQHG